ncbi:2-hydroxyacid dehydrogenase [Tolypocladium capitatum]|uniref:2-hydroxyacid dehydrogenase n=1 Tax=Tolypocladium capitatum TaxID=45235 RepID=A0A2K3QNV1_9HYPO|nr:2-hydroxyacid dehydrogenase [Tolypocladium capitatum]
MAADMLPRFLLPRLSWGAPLSASRAAARPVAAMHVARTARQFSSLQHGQSPVRRRPAAARSPMLILGRAFHETAMRQRDHHFDTLKFVKRLQSEGFTEPQSVAMMKVLNDVIEESIQNLTRTMVLREDAAKATYTQKVDFAKLRSELLSADSTESNTTRSAHERLTNDIAKLSSRLRDEIGRTQASVRLDLNLEKGRIREEAVGQELKIKETEIKIEQEVAALREKLEQVKFQTLQWLMGVCTGFAALLLGAWRLLIWSMAEAAPESPGARSIRHLRHVPAFCGISQRLPGHGKLPSELVETIGSSVVPQGIQQVTRKKLPPHYISDGLLLSTAPIMNQPRNRQPRNSLRGNPGSSSSRASPATSRQATGSVPTAQQVVPGASVSIVLKEDQPTGQETPGVIADVLTRGNHPRGIKVRLRDGQVGRVQRMGPKPSSAFSTRYSDVRDETELAEELPARSLADFMPAPGDDVQPVPDVVAAPGLATCPVCQAFEGDEAAVTHHIERRQQHIFFTSARVLPSAYLALTSSPCLHQASVHHGCQVHVGCRPHGRRCHGRNARNAAAALRLWCSRPQRGARGISGQFSIHEARLNERSMMNAAGINIDTHIHILASDKSVAGGFVTEDTVAKQMKVLNDSFAKSNVSFTLKSTDWTVDAGWAQFQDELNMKTKMRRVHTAPSTVREGSDSWFLDGCDIFSGSTPGGNAQNYNEGKSATHEVGHWFGLMHAFEGGCSDPGDYVDDTPSQASPTNGCPISRNSCPKRPGLDPIHNYMDYSYDSCFWEFTNDQINRMKNMWRHYRAGK